jgi:cyclin B
VPALEPETEPESVKEENFCLKLFWLILLLPAIETSRGVLAEEYVGQAFSDIILAVNDMDSEDRADSNICSECVKNIYAYLRQLEEKQSVRPKYLLGHKIAGNMGAILIVGLVQVQRKCRLLQKTVAQLFPLLISSCRIIVCPRRCCSWLVSLPCLLQANLKKCSLQKLVILLL